jgi:hypothetical protein
VEAFAELIGDGDEMIAASYACQSVVTRLADPVLTGAILLGRAPLLALDDVRWSASVNGPTVGLGLPTIVPTTPEQALDRLLVVIADLADLIRGEVRIAHRLLYGNAAASLLGACRRIAALPAGAQTVPAVRQGAPFAATCHRLSTAVVDALGRPAVACLVDIDGWSTFQRRTCCLLRFAGARGVCDECSFLAPAEFTCAQLAVRRRLVRW